MQKLIVIKEGAQARVMQVETEAGDLDLRRGIRDAALEYCRTEEGKRICRNRKGFDYQSFAANVPNAICARHGFQKGTVMECDMVVDAKEQLIDGRDMACLFGCPGLEPGREYEVVEAAVRLARMWGVMETLENVEDKGWLWHQMDAGRLIAWAEEFVDEGRADLVDFFREKMVL